MDWQVKSTKKTCTILNYVEHLPILISTTCASLVVIFVGIASSAAQLNICKITAGIKKCNSIIMKIEKNIIK